MLRTFWPSPSRLLLIISLSYRMPVLVIYNTSAPPGMHAQYHLPHCSSSVIDFTAQHSRYPYAQRPRPQHVSEQIKPFFTGPASS
ncbi:hypothetical protein FA95DRAFT_1046404 [Auriscalpium vulgare]|uniref:Uncharacterized protein n=1 Tax=Auriscalpium vulgare TaxID=40419 RepID=A0ACB8S966_9AGAM|nr:hypothetical protein FA95DRAFT_1046404 [Auriscalpium vulgare]